MARAARGYTHLEVLVAAAAVVVVVGLLVPAVMKVRAAAARARCTNNLKQIGTGLLAYHDARGHFPAGGSPSPDSSAATPSAREAAGWSWAYTLLPYVGHDQLYRDADPEAVRRTAVDVYLCPARRTTADPTGLAKLDYAVNGAVDPDRPTGVIAPFGVPPLRLADLAGGTGGVVVFAGKRLNRAALGASRDDDDAYATAGWGPDFEVYRTAAVPPAPDVDEPGTRTPGGVRRVSPGGVLCRLRRRLGPPAAVHDRPGGVGAGLPAVRHPGSALARQLTPAATCPFPPAVRWGMLTGDPPTASPRSEPAMPLPPLSRLAPAVLLLVPATARAADPVDFARDVRPLLSNTCFKCHGPASQMGKVRLDTREAAVKSGAIVPGSPDKSTLVERVCDPTDDGRMPPAEAGPRLTPAQVQTLKDWIAQGAEYTPHWAFQRVQRPQLPNGKATNPIDRFVLARLEKAALTPAPEADRPTLIRRVTLDLTGLLPTPAEVQAFLDDRAPDAFEKVVDRLLASPHYGERQARHWLDMARYADSNGYTIDGPRSIWPYRDWVIRALNSDLPFDQFTTQQLAGDLIPGATTDHKVATGFHRNTSFNEEGGTDPEQFRVERTVDRANTTGAVWLGLTVGCAQCHTHKYDPVTQHDYYRLYAFFDSCDEPTMPIGGSAKLEDTIAKLNHMEFWVQKNGGDREDIDRVRAEIKKVQGKITTTLVMRERPAPRQTHVQIRGDFLRKGDVVQPGFPPALGTSPVSTGGKRLSRLDLARWLVSRDNPLTARVTVNREWQKFFGRGLVETENDFGMQGSLPTHPELLDWLAAEFMEGHAWSMKKLHRQIVTSATYRQASTLRPDQSQKDPRNLLLGRQSRLRLEAEVIRDAALTASGKLNAKLGGPGVYPPQPKEVFAFTQSQRTWPESKGPDRYRRGVYTYIWRQSQHPLLTTFDGADAQTACTKRNRSNTPLQALHLANDPVFVELATELGRRIEKDGGADDAAKVRFAYRTCFARDPESGEAARLLAYLEAQQRTNPTTAWPATARVLMNLDEFITRE